MKQCLLAGEFCQTRILGVVEPILGFPEPVEPPSVFQGRTLPAVQSLKCVFQTGHLLGGQLRLGLSPLLVNLVARFVQELLCFTCLVASLATIARRAASRRLPHLVCRLLSRLGRLLGREPLQPAGRRLGSLLQLFLLGAELLKLRPFLLDVGLLIIRRGGRLLHRLAQSCLSLAKIGDLLLGFAKLLHQTAPVHARGDW